MALRKKANGVRSHACLCAGCRSTFLSYSALRSHFTKAHALPAIAECEAAAEAVWNEFTESFKGLRSAFSNQRGNVLAESATKGPLTRCGHCAFASRDPAKLTAHFTGPEKHSPFASSVPERQALLDAARSEHFRSLSPLLPTTRRPRSPVSTPEKSKEIRNDGGHVSFESAAPPLGPTASAHASPHLAVSLPIRIKLYLGKSREGRPAHVFAHLSLPDNPTVGALRSRAISILGLLDAAALLAFGPGSNEPLADSVSFSREQAHMVYLRFLPPFELTVPSEDSSLTTCQVFLLDTSEAPRLLPTVEHSTTTIGEYLKVSHRLLGTSDRLFVFSDAGNDPLPHTDPCSSHKAIYVTWVPATTIWPDCFSSEHGWSAEAIKRGLVSEGIEGNPGPCVQVRPAFHSCRHPLCLMRWATSLLWATQVLLGCALLCGAISLNASLRLDHPAPTSLYGRPDPWAALVAAAMLPPPWDVSTPPWWRSSPPTLSMISSRSAARPRGSRRTRFRLSGSTANDPTSAWARSRLTIITLLRRARSAPRGFRSLPPGTFRVSSRRPSFTHLLSLLLLVCILALAVASFLRLLSQGIHPQPGPSPPASALPSLRFMSWNMNHLCTARLVQLLSALEAHAVDICALQEVWVLSDPNLVEIRKAGYDVVFLKRPGREGGGVALILRRAVITHRALTRPPASTVPAFVECVGAEVSVCGFPPFSVASVYVPPDDNLPGTLEAALSTLTTAWSLQLIGGDLNARHLLWDPAPPHTRRDATSWYRGDSLVQWIVSAGVGLGNATSPPVATYRKPEPYGTTPDLILFPGNELAASPASVLTGVIGSDHWPLLVEISPSTGSPAPPPLSRRVTFVAWGKVTDAHRAKFRSAVSRCLKNSPARGSLDRRAAHVTRAITDAAKCFPRGFVGHALPGWSPELDVMRQDCSTLLRTNDPAATEAVRKYTEECRASLIRHRESAGADMDAWAFHRRYQRPPAPNCAVQKGPTGPWARTPQQRATLFASIFKEKHRARKHVPAFDPPPIDTPPLITSAELLAALAGHPLRSALDPDGISAELLLLLPQDALDVIRALFDDMLATGLLPARWRFSLMLALLKEGKPPGDALSYRPVSLTSLLMRTLERILLARMDYLILNRLGLSQFGYRKTLGADMVLAQLVLDVTDGWRQSSNVRSFGAVQTSTVVWALDFTDAFPSIAPQDVCRELAALGVPPYMTHFMASFLTGRTLSVLCAGTRSAVVPSDWGAPQGSITGGRCWDVVSNVLAVSLSVALQQEFPKRGFSARSAWLADDLTVWITGSFASPDQLAAFREGSAIVLELIATWAFDRGIDLSSKSDALWLTPATKPREFLLPEMVTRCGPITLAPRLKGFLRLLGLLLDSRLSFLDHVERLRVEARKDLLHLQWMSWYLPFPKLRQLYWGSVLSRVLYASHIFWPLLSANSKTQLEIIHREGCRIITGTCASANSAACLAEAGFRSLDVLVARQGHRRWFHFASLPDSSPAKQVLLRPPPPLGRPSTRGADGAPFERRTFRMYGPPGGAPPPPLLPPPAVLPYAPWLTASASRVVFLTTHACKAASPAAEKLASSLAVIESAGPHDAELFSDGSVIPVAIGRVLSGSAADLYLRDSVAPLEAATSAGPQACSFSTEAGGIICGLDLFEALPAPPVHPAPAPPTPATPTPAVPSPPLPEHLLCCTDSLSNVQMLAKGPLRQDTWYGVVIWERLLRIASTTRVTVAFVFAHCGLPRNEAIDVKAKTACALTDDPRALRTWPKDAARALSRADAVDYDTSTDMGFRGRASHDPACLNPTRGTCRYAPSKTPPLRSRAQFRLLFQLRTGVCARLGGMRHGVPPEKCPRCAEPCMRRSGVFGGPNAVDHLFACPATRALRDLHGVHFTKDLWEKPAQCVAYALDFLATTPPPPVAVAPSAAVSPAAAPPAPPPPRGKKPALSVARTRAIPSAGPPPVAVGHPPPPALPGE